MKTKHLCVATALSALLALLALPGCITTQLYYENDDVADHKMRASLTLSGKEPVLSFGATKATRPYDGIRAGNGK